MAGAYREFLGGQPSQSVVGIPTIADEGAPHEEARGGGRNPRLLHMSTRRQL